MLPRSLVLSIPCSCQHLLDLIIFLLSKDPFLGASSEQAPCELIPRVSRGPGNDYWARHHLAGQKVSQEPH